ncbi:hypothetical protein FUAX_50640 (plasmid) [Fulvitalea axinellae]|uniref:Tail specific protease domain-containing protein n=1 Tax=Fulvitalea axinellae TaxID=1182444 RepID=A0AAU9D0G2_9BACT|nr:hypothetical protein FUAX_50640 [Fulvitalea axinellae]
MLKDGHTNVYMPVEVANKLYGVYFGDYRFVLSNIDGQTVVTRINKEKIKEIPLGTVITEVNGMPTAEYQKKYVKPYISSSTDYIVEDYAAFRLLKAPEGTKHTVVFRRPDGKEKTLELTCGKEKELALYPEMEEWKRFEFKWLKKGVAYISLNSFGSPEIIDMFKKKLPEIYKAKKLVVDLRKNGGGSTSTGLAILQYLTTDNVFYGSKSRSRLHIPSYKAWGGWAKAEDTVGMTNPEGLAWHKQALESARDEYYHDFPYSPDSVSLDEKRIKVPTVLLIGHKTASAAEDFLILADNQKHMTKMGERTFGSTGQPMVFDLPGGGSARVCTKQDLYPDGREFIGVGVLPDIEVKKTLEDFIKDRDPGLKAALKFLKEQDRAL